MSTAIFTALEKSIETVGALDEPDGDAALQLWNALDLAKALMKDLETQAKEVLLEVLDKTGPVPITETRKLKITVTRHTVGLDSRKTLDILFDRCQGDVESVAEHFSAQPFKPAACKNTIGEGSESLFTTKVKKNVHGDPEKKPAIVDETFTQPNKGNRNGQSSDRSGPK